MKRHQIFSVGLCAVGILSLFGCATSENKDQKKDAPPQTINAYVVRQAPLTQSIEAAGNLLAEEEVQLAPEISGRVVQLNFKEGQLVQKGQLLVKLADADLQAQLQKLLAQLSLAENTVDRQLKLLSVQGISQQDFDLSQTQVNGLKADVAVIKAQIAKTAIYAPFQGKIGLKNISPGAYVNAGTVITSLQKSGKMKLDFSVPERYQSLVRLGDPVEFTVDGRSESFKAQVYATEPQISLGSRSLQVRAWYSNSAGLIPGAFANVKLGLAEDQKAIMIPTQAIIPEARNKKVIVVRNGLAQFQIVETGQREADRIQITQGLQEGDTVVTTGLMQIKPEAPVKIGKVTDINSTSNAQSK